MEKKPVEPLGVALRVQSLHDLLTNNETPLRGSALPKSMPPNPVSNNVRSSHTTVVAPPLVVSDLFPVSILFFP